MKTLTSPVPLKNIPNIPSRRLVSPVRFATAILLAATLTPLCAETVTWNAGLAPDTNWVTTPPSSFGNWTDGVNPAGNDLLFTSTGLSGSSATVTNTVNENITVRSLLYQYNSANNWHVTAISADVTLTVSGVANLFTVGGQSGETTTRTALTGFGTLAIEQSGGRVFIGNNSNTTTPAVTTLQMNSLATFRANLDTTGSFEVGVSTGSASPSNQRSAATVYLADTNEITAGNLRISVALNDGVSVLTTGDQSTLYLGRENDFRVSRIDVGHSQGTSVNGAIKFDPSVTGGSIRLRGITGGETDAVSRLRIGYNAGGTTSNSQTGVVDFSGGEVDALITELTVGSGLGNGTGRAVGSLIMSAGTMTVQRTTIGQGRSAGAAAATVTTSGTLDLRGGTFNTEDLILADSTASTLLNKPVTGTVKIEGDAAVTVTGTNGLVMGRHGGSGNASVLTARIDLDGGSLTVNGGDLTEGFSGSGGITSTLNLRGGILDLKGHAVKVDNFNIEGGTIQNAAQINNGANLIKTTSGTLSIAGTNRWTGGLTVQAGRVDVFGSIANGSITVQSGATFSLQSTGILQSNIISESIADTFLLEAGGTASFDGFLRFHLAEDFATGSWQLFESTTQENFAELRGIELTGAFTGFLSFSGGNQWSATYGDRIYVFDTETGIFSADAVPEPSAMLFGVVGTALWAWGHRRKWQHSRNSSQPDAI